jgi:hypothetical protein
MFGKIQALSQWLENPADPTERRKIKLFQELMRM